MSWPSYRSIQGRQMRQLGVYNSEKASVLKWGGGSEGGWRMGGLTRTGALRPSVTCCTSRADSTRTDMACRGCENEFHDPRELRPKWRRGQLQASPLVPRQLFRWGASRRVLLFGGQKVRLPTRSLRLAAERAQTSDHTRNLSRKTQTRACETRQQVTSRRRNHVRLPPRSPVRASSTQATVS